MVTNRASARHLVKGVGWLRALVAFGLLAIALSDAALGADLPMPGNKPGGDFDSILHFSISGRIEPGETARVESFLSANNFDEGDIFGKRAVAFLNSQDGDFDEGMKLGLLFASRHIETFVAKGSVCSSACALAFMGGSLRGEEGASFPSRTLAIGGQIGFHAPSLVLPEGDLTKAAVDTAYDAAIATISAIASNAEGLGLRRSLLPAVLTGGSDRHYEMRTVDDLGLFGIATDLSFVARALTKSMAVNLCHNAYQWGADRSAADKENGLGSPLEIDNVDIQSGYFSREKMPATRTAIRTAAAAEGSSYYCIVDHSVIDGRLAVACRGFMLAYDLHEAIERARTLDVGDGSGSADLDCRIPGSINALEGYQAFTDRPRVYAFAPADATIGSIDSVLAGYESTEQPLATDHP